MEPKPAEFSRPAGSAQVIDTPEGIQAYRLLAIRGALKLQCLGMRGRVNAAEEARAELKRAGRPCSSRQYRKLLAVYEAYLREIGVLSSQGAPQ